MADLPSTSIRDKNFANWQRLTQDEFIHMFNRDKAHITLFCLKQWNIAMCQRGWFKVLPYLVPHEIQTRRMYNVMNYLRVTVGYEMVPHTMISLHLIESEIAKLYKTYNESFAVRRS